MLIICIRQLYEPPNVINNLKKESNIMKHLYKTLLATLDNINACLNKIANPRPSMIKVKCRIYNNKADLDLYRFRYINIQSLNITSRINFDKNEDYHVLNNGREFRIDKAELDRVISLLIRHGYIIE